MNGIVSIRPLLAILVSLCITPLLASSRNSNIREAWTFFAATLKFLIVVSMLPVILKGENIYFTVAHIMPGLSISLRVDALGMIFALVSSSLWIITSAYSIGYMRGLKEHSQTRYFCFFALAMSATIGVAFSANLITMYMFYEMLSFATYPLVTHHQDEEAKGSGRRYLFYIVGTSIGFVLPSMIITYYFAGTLEFRAGGILHGIHPEWLFTLTVFMFIFGFAKVAIMPFHAWLPAAMVAPTPVSALLHAVAVVKVGAFCIIRVITQVLGKEMLTLHNLNLLICLIASITILVGSLIALSQDEFKRRLAFSTISQLSYIVLGVALLNPKAFIGASCHIAMHAFGKITLFFCAGNVFVATGIKHISKMKGIGKRMPITMLAFFIGSLSVIGLPPTGGFFSKWYLLLGTVNVHSDIFLAVLLISSLLNAAYFLPIVYNAFFYPEEESQFEGGIKEAPLWCLIPTVLCALGSIGLFFFPELFLNLSKIALNLIGL